MAGEALGGVTHQLLDVAPNLLAAHLRQAIGPVGGRRPADPAVLTAGEPAQMRERVAPLLVGGESQVSPCRSRRSRSALHRRMHVRR